MSNNSESRICQNCHQSFLIEPEDFLFYEKIKVPPPTFCPHCRFVRRMIWRNERSLYKRVCNMCQKSIISMYDDNVSFSVYCPDCWKSDKWGPSSYGQDYDFSKLFFSQWFSLFNKVPRQALFRVGECIDSEYSNFAKDTKNVYLAYSALDCEDTYYSGNIDFSKGVFDSYNVINGELLYENMGVVKNYNCQYTYWSSNCINSNFMMDSNNCQDCFGCVNLQNKRYCILNEQYTKEEYKERMKELDIGSHSFVKEFLNKFIEFSLDFPRKYLRMINCVNSFGDELRDSRNAKHCFRGHGCENVKYGYRVSHAHDSMDVCHSWAELAYEHSTGGSENGSNIKFVINGGNNNNNVEYSDHCKASSNLFGCVGLQSQKYCILNKQYNKESFEKLKTEIIKQMNDMPYIDKKGNIYKYGEFFPMEFCPFGYNETIVNEHFPLDKDKIYEIGSFLKDKTENKYTFTLKAKDILDNIKDVGDDILDEVIECELSGKAFKITPFELQFYRRMNIPIPHLHPDERYKERFKLRNPMRLWHRKCMKEGCKNEFETTYAPERPEIVYCDECYKREVY